LKVCVAALQVCGAVQWRATSPSSPRPIPICLAFRLSRWMGSRIRLEILSTHAADSIRRFRGAIEREPEHFFARCCHRTTTVVAAVHALEFRYMLTEKMESLTVGCHRLLDLDLGLLSGQATLRPVWLYHSHGTITSEISNPRHHHGIDFRSRKNPPLGPSSGNVASHTMVSAPCSTERSACGPPMSVRTQPGHTELTLM